jgi:sugar diacid utilization regulator
VLGPPGDELVLSERHAEVEVEVTVAAAELGIHRNTLRERIARIETLTGRRVNTAAGRADLWIALEIADEHLPPAAIV